MNTLHVCTWDVALLTFSSSPVVMSSILSLPGIEDKEVRDCFPIWTLRIFIRETLTCLHFLVALSCHLLLPYLGSRKDRSLQKSFYFSIIGKYILNSNSICYTFFIRKSSFCLSLNFLNFSRNWAWECLSFFSTFSEINWLKWFTLSLLILCIWIWIPPLTFWIQ